MPEAQLPSEGRHPVLGAEGLLQLPDIIRAVPRQEPSTAGDDVCYSQTNCGRPMRSGIQIVKSGGGTANSRSADALAA